MTLTLPWVAGIILGLMATPLLAMILVRMLIPLTPVTGLEAQPEAPLEPAIEFTSLGEFWQSMVPHLTELRDRLMKAGGALIVGVAISSVFVFNKLIYGQSLTDIVYNQFVPEPIDLLAATVAEAFVNSMHIALLAGLILALPVVVYQSSPFSRQPLTQLRSAWSSPLFPFWLNCLSPD